MKKAYLDGLTIPKINEALLHTKTLVQSTIRSIDSLTLLMGPITRTLENVEYELLGYLQDIVERNSEMCDLEWLSHPGNIYWLEKKTRATANQLQIEMTAASQDITEYQHSEEYTSAVEHLYAYALPLVQSDPKYDLDSDPEYVRLKYILDEQDAIVQGLIERYQGIASTYAYTKYLADQYKLRWNTHKEECRKYFYFNPGEFTYSLGYEPYNAGIPGGILHIEDGAKFITELYHGETGEDESRYETVDPNWTYQVVANTEVETPTVPIGTIRSTYGDENPFVYVAGLFLSFKIHDYGTNSRSRNDNYYGALQSTDEDDTVINVQLIDKVHEGQLALYQQEVDERGNAKALDEPFTVFPGDKTNILDITSVVNQYGVPQLGSNSFGDNLILMTYLDVTPTRNFKDYLPGYSILDFIDRDYPGKTL